MLLILDPPPSTPPTFSLSASPSPSPLALPSHSPHHDLHPPSPHEQQSPALAVLPCAISMFNGNPRFSPDKLSSISKWNFNYKPAEF